MGKRYLHDALRSSPVEKTRFYSVEDMIALLTASSTLPRSLTRSRLRMNLKTYIDRNISKEFSREWDGTVGYLGAAWLFPVPRLYPLLLSEVREEMERALARPFAPRTPKKPVSRSRKVVRLGLLVTGFGFILLFSGWNTTSLLRFIRSNPKSMIADASQKGDLSFSKRYFLAEAHLASGNLESAEKIAYDLLKSRTIPTYIEGNSNLLLAKINLQRGQYETALGQAGLARTAYENAPENTSGNIRAVETLTIDILIHEEHYLEALTKLSSSYERETNETFRAYLALLTSDVNFWLEDYGGAQDWGETALAGYRRTGDRVGQANARMNKAWLHAIMGELNLASQEIEKAESLMNLTGANLMRPQINLTKALINRCSGKPHSLTSFRQSSNPMFLRYVDFVETYSTDHDPIVVNNPPPGGGNETPPKKETDQIAMN